MYSRRGVTSTAHHHLAPRLTKEFRAIPLLSTWAFIFTYRVKFTFTFTRSKRK